MSSYNVSIRFKLREKRGYLITRIPIVVIIDFIKVKV
jgi:hypothetical protein